MTLQVASLGDSTSCGQGVGLGIPLWQTWPALLAAAVPGGRLLPLAVPGARVRDVRAGQVQRAVASSPALVTLLIGLNDVWRGGFSASSYAANLHAVLRSLAPTGATVLLGRLHDPSRLLPLPRRVKEVVHRRVAEVNRAVDDVGVPPQVLVLDLAAIGGLRCRRAWDLDRVHPSREGHALIAAHAAEVLRRDGLPVSATQRFESCASPSLVQEGRWLARAGLPWMVGRLPALRD